MRSCPHHECVHVSSDEAEGEVKATKAASHILVKEDAEKCYSRHSSVGPYEANTAMRIQAIIGQLASSMQRGGWSDVSRE